MPSHIIYLDDGKYNYTMRITLSDCTVSVTTDGVGFNAHSSESHDFATENEALEFYDLVVGLSLGFGVQG